MPVEAQAQTMTSGKAPGNQAAEPFRGDSAPPGGNAIVKVKIKGKPDQIVQAMRGMS